METLDIPTPEERAEAVRALEDAREAHPFKGSAPRTLRRADIVVMPTVFQPRDAVDAGLIGELVTALRGTGKPFSERVAVTWAPDAAGRARWAVVDGHHRLAAYERAKWSKAIPVEVVAGTVEDAGQVAFERNKENKARLSPSARMERAWLLVCRVATGARKMTHKQIMDAAGVSRSQVKDQMFPACRELIADGWNPGEFTWAMTRARKVGKGLNELEQAKADAKRATGLRDAILKAGFKPSAHLDALLEALRLIDERLPQRIAQRVQQQRLNAEGWRSLSDVDEVPGEDEEDHGDF